MTTLTRRWFRGAARIVGFLVAVFLAAAAPAPAAALEHPPAVDARAAVLIDAASGRVLHAYNADARMPMASTTKIMTGWLLAERAAPDDIIWVPFEARGIQGSKLYLEPGERYSARDMLLALMIESANDAAVAIAVNLAGSVEDFADLMNRRAAELGLKNTRFANPHGLDAEGHYSSARDLALLARAAMTHPAFREAVSLTEAVIAHPIKGSTREIHSHNRFLVSYPGATGVKTGFTNGAGFSLVGSARRGEVELIGVILGGSSDVRVAQKMAELMDWGFSSFAPRQVVAQGETVVMAAAEGAEGGARPAGTGDAGAGGAQAGSAGTTTWVTQEPLMALLPAGEPLSEDQLTWRVEGGRLHVFYRGESLGSVALAPAGGGNQAAEDDGGHSGGPLERAGAGDARFVGAAAAALLGLTVLSRRRRAARRHYSWQARRDGWGPRP